MSTPAVTHSEYAAARGSAVLVERNDRAFVRVYGRDPVKMVQGLITNDLATASAGRSVYAGMLTPKGKLIADMRVLQRGPDVLIETDGAALANIMANFKKYVPPLFARAEDVTSQYTMFGVYGPESRALLAPRAELPDSIDHTREQSDGTVLVRSDYIDEDGWDIIAQGEGATSIAAALANVTRASLDTLEVLRIEAGTPRWGAELDENVIPLEAGLRERMISETKGCYTGQEVIIRILHRGHVNRMLRGALLGSADAPAHDTELFTSDGKQVGRITSSCVSPRHGQTIALCYARRELVLPVTLRAGAPGVDAQVVTLPFARTEKA